MIIVRDFLINIFINLINCFISFCTFNKSKLFINFKKMTYLIIITY